MAAARSKEPPTKPDRPPGPGPGGGGGGGVWVGGERGRWCVGGGGVVGGGGGRGKERVGRGKHNFSTVHKRKIFNS